MEPYKLDRNSPYFIKKYFPKSTSELTTNYNKIRLLNIWLDSYTQNSLKCRNLNKKKVKTDILVKFDENDDINMIDLDLDIDIGSSSTKQKNNLNEKSCLIITGQHGIGKSALVYTILTEKKYDISVINFEKVNQMKNITEFIEKTMKGVDIYSSIINKKHTQNRVIVIDNIEIVSSPNEKLFISSILKQNELEWIFPIIFICNNKHNKLINHIKKASFVENDISSGDEPFFYKN